MRGWNINMSVYAIISLIIGIILLSYGLLVFFRKINGIHGAIGVFINLPALYIAYVIYKAVVIPDNKIEILVIPLIIIFLANGYYNERCNYDILFVSVKNAAELIADKYI